MMAFSIRHLDDFNEITSHMLEVIQAHLHSDSTVSGLIIHYHSMAVGCCWLY